MRLRIGENARVTRAFSPIRAEYVYRIVWILLPIFQLFKKLVAPKRPQLILRSNMIRRRTRCTGKYTIDIRIRFLKINNSFAENMFNNKI
jgi:hypothetical protein